ncbi:OmpP1/FadL family transporter [Roseibacillus ishigakijimensis]|uniref:Outer membrane protein transport protein n=1 Tax=Roseibacillus ishigakijimensis TaxID=454146 RepID=A0A934RPP0_9BACT|nr:outer membrane protein transport protein [Roseibacillus ishigakijimensis]MBK1832824.1 outer membrane protein transport protein [Roseibacillus ishigakijimensis]
MNTALFTAPVGLLSLLALTASTRAAGFGFEYQSARASARGNTSSPSEGGAELLHYNPGALVWAERPNASANLFFPAGEVEVRQGTQTYELEDNERFAGSFFYAHPFEIHDRRLAVGFGVRTPYGQEAEWPSSVPFARFGQSAEMTHLEYLLGGAVELGQGFSLGANLVIIDSELKTATRGLIFPNDRQRFSGDDEALAFQLGLHHQVTPRFSWGIGYRSGFDLDYEGSVSYQSGTPFLPDGKLDARSPLDFPAHWTLEADWLLSESWSLGFRVQWSGWSAVDKLAVETPAQSVEQPVDWQDSWLVGVGTTWQVNPLCSLHAGYLYVESAMEEPYQTPLNSDFDQHLLSLGTSLHLGSWRGDLALVRVIAESRRSQTSLYGFQGHHENEGWFLNAGISCQF